MRTDIVSQCMDPKEYKQDEVTVLEAKFDDKGNMSADLSATTNTLTCGPKKILTITPKIPIVKFTDSKTHNDEVIALPGILDYVNIKYGTPRTQLKNLSEKGFFETVVVDTSGVGSGPVIHCPVESHVYLPTPKHKNCGTTLHDHRNKMIGVNQVPICDNSSTDAKLTFTLPLPSSGGRLVYGSEQEKQNAFMGCLEFESRFESGNLFQAFQL